MKIELEDLRMELVEVRENISVAETVLMARISEWSV